MSKHTPEPWYCQDNGTYFDIYGGNDQQRIGDTCASSCDGNRDLGEINARRIVACVNACAGMADPASEIAELKRQRDELLAALHDAATSLETIQLRSFGADSLLDDKHSMRAYAGARAAVARESIAKAKGGAANHFPYAAKMVPDGWKLVPVVATEEMVNSGHAAWSDGEDDFQSFAMAYGAMLAAAPKFE